ncbi:hypothetical protein B0H13DRAFT_2557242 [Mycena leptocephala]|nr:hypothetical protein B0H13DRAFT_2557242 [Mycena leptocephala]
MPTARLSPSCETWNHGQDTPSHRPPCRSMGRTKSITSLSKTRTKQRCFSKSCRLGLLPPKTYTLRRAADNHLEWPQGRAAMVRLEPDDITRRGEQQLNDTTQEPQHPLHPRASSIPRTSLPPRLSPTASTKKQPGLPSPSYRAQPAVVCPCPAPAPAPSFHPSVHLLPSVPKRTRRLLDLPPTRLPDPRLRNLVVGSRARAERMREFPIAPIAALEHLRFASRQSWVQMLGAFSLPPLVVQRPCSDAPHGAWVRCQDTADTRRLRSITVTSITTKKQRKNTKAPSKHPSHPRPPLLLPHAVLGPPSLALLLDLPPTCIPDPNPRHHNPVVGIRARVESGLGSWRYVAILTLGIRWALVEGLLSTVGVRGAENSGRALVVGMRTSTAVVLRTNAGVPVAALELPHFAVAAVVRSSYGPSGAHHRIHDVARYGDTWRGTVIRGDWEYAALSSCILSALGAQYGEQRSSCKTHVSASRDSVEESADDGVEEEAEGVEGRRAGKRGRE